MGERIEDGGPAFPGDMPTVQLDGNKLPFAPGMSLRDWFAGQALAGVFRHDGWLNTFDGDQEELASRAYAVADAMLKARASSQGGPPDV